MKKFAEEVVKYFWIPLIMGLVSYIFFQLKDVVLGIIVLVGLSAVYTLVRLYFIHKKWWLLIILMVVVFAAGGAYFLRAPTTSLTINGEKITGAETEVGGGTVMVNPAPQNGLYPKGAIVTLTASAGQGRDFKSWVGTINDATNPTTIKMDGDKEIRANFDARYSLIINNQIVIGSFLNLAEGDITVSPAPDSDGKYTSGATVNLSVRPNTGYDWQNWIGTANDTVNPTMVVMTGGNKNITVNFEGRFALYIGNRLVIGANVNVENGVVTVSPAPGDDDKYAYGTKITMTARPDTGYGWKNWNGTTDDAVNPAAVTINSEKHVDVSFEERYLVMVNNQALKTDSLDVTGGSIAVSPTPGEDNRFKKDTVATLTAAPAQGYRFDKWTGDVSDVARTVSLILDKSKSITANFIRIYNLITAVNDPAGGTVSPDKGVYDSGAEITLTATPAAGYRFSKWTGAVSGDNTLVKVNFASDISVTAEFIRVFSLTTAAEPADGGAISVASGTYDEGTVLNILALPAEGFDFSGWTGDVSGNVTSANLTMTRDMSVVAIFIPKPAPPPEP